MLTINWPEVIAKSKKGNNAAFNSAVTQNYSTQFKGPLITLTSNEETAFELYLDVMAKFWERFVLKGEDLPKQNINGYIFRMVRNRHVDLNRKQKSIKQINTVELDHKKLIHQINRIDMANEESDQDHQFNQDSENQNLIALENAISKLCDNCKQLIERNVFNGERLKVLKTELGYTGSYQTIVEKKKRCIKKLTKLFFMELNEKDVEAT